MVLTADRKKRIKIFGATIALILALYWWHRDPVPHNNPGTKRWASIITDTSDLPVAADTARVVVQYEIENTDCLKPLFPSGASRTFTHRTDVPTTRTTPHSFMATIALNPFKDEDYEGRGECRWRVSVITVNIDASSYRLEANAAGSIVEQMNTTTLYYPGTLFKGQAATERTWGRGDPSTLHLSPGERIYHVSLTAKEASHDGQK